MVREVSPDVEDDQIYDDDTDANYLPNRLYSRRVVKAIPLKDLDLQIHQVKIDLNPPYQRGEELCASKSS